MIKASEDIKKYIKSKEYILLVIICLVYSALIFLKGFNTSDGILILLNDKLYLNFGLLLIFLIYIYRNINKNSNENLLESWVNNAKTIISLSTFTIISLVVFSILLGEVINILGLERINEGSLILDKVNDFRSISVIQVFTGLTYLAILTMTMSFEDFKVSKFILIAFALYYLFRIIFPTEKSFIWFMAPLNQLSAYYALDYNISGPYLMAILHCLGVVIIGNVLIIIEKLLRKIK